MCPCRTVVQCPRPGGCSSPWTSLSPSRGWLAGIWMVEAGHMSAVSGEKLTPFQIELCDVVPIEVCDIR